MTTSLKNNIISITDIRKNATTYIAWLPITWDKIIFELWFKWLNDGLWFLN